MNKSEDERQGSLENVRSVLMRLERAPLLYSQSKTEPEGEAFVLSFELL